MRSPNKSRSRNKNNRRGGGGGGANLGNALNRVYESAGPDGKVRGTPVQVIEKYQALAHDSALAGDRVATENFQQHAEHYIRLINDVQRQLAEQREAQQQNQQQNAQNGNGRAQHNGNGGGNANSNGNGNGAPQPPHQPGAEQPRIQAEPEAEAQPKDETLSVLDADPGEAEQPSGLVETPETAPKKAETGDAPKRRRTRSRSSAKKDDDAAPTAAPEPSAE